MIINLIIYRNIRDLHKLAASAEKIFPEICAENARYSSTRDHFNIRVRTLCIEKLPMR